MFCTDQYEVHVLLSLQKLFFFFFFLLRNNIHEYSLYIWCRLCSRVDITIITLCHCHHHHTFLIPQLPLSHLIENSQTTHSLLQDIKLFNCYFMFLSQWYLVFFQNQTWIFNVKQRRMFNPHLIDWSFVHFHFTGHEIVHILYFYITLIYGVSNSKIWIFHVVQMGVTHY